MAASMYIIQHFMVITKLFYHVDNKPVCFNSIDKNQKFCYCIDRMNLLKQFTYKWLFARLIT